MAWVDLGATAAPDSFSLVCLYLVHLLMEVCGIANARIFTLEALFWRPIKDLLILLSYLSLFIMQTSNFFLQLHAVCLQG